MSIIIINVITLWIQKLIIIVTTEVLWTLSYKCLYIDLKLIFVKVSLHIEAHVSFIVCRSKIW